MLEVLGIKNADKLVPLPDDMKAKDPVSENMDLLKGEPAKAFLFQDHEAHIQVHMAMIQDPMIQQLIGQNPKAPQMQAALMAHVAEHAGFAYRQKIEQQLGMPLPPEDEKMPPQIELALSGMMAQAANQVLQQNQSQAAQAQAQQQAQDPIVQMQQQELQLKGREVAVKEAKLKLDEMKITGDQQLAGMKVGAQIKDSQAKQASQDQREGLKIGVDIAKAKQQAAGNDPAMAALRAQHELNATAQRHEQEMAANRDQRQMAAQQHMQNLAHKDQVHAQNLKHQRAQAKAQQELTKKPENNPKEKTDK
jgi:hypothetical protein